VRNASLIGKNVEARLCNSSRALPMRDPHKG